MKIIDFIKKEVENTVNEAKRLSPSKVVQISNIDN